MAAYTLRQEPRFVPLGGQPDLGNLDAVARILSAAFPDITFSQDGEYGSAIVPISASDTMLVTFTVMEDRDPRQSIRMSVPDPMKAAPIHHSIWSHSPWSIFQIDEDTGQEQVILSPDQENRIRSQ